MTRCHYQHCKSPTSQIHQCPYCKLHFCPSHIAPSAPSVINIHGSRSFSFETYEHEHAHPCQEFLEAHNIQMEEEINAQEIENEKRQKQIRLDCQEREFRRQKKMEKYLSKKHKPAKPEETPILSNDSAPDTRTYKERHGIAPPVLFEEVKGLPWWEKETSSWSKLLPYLFVVLMLGTVALALLMPDDLRSFVLQSKDCSPGLRSWHCAPTKPLYCDNGKLIDRADICNCSDGFRKYLNNSCILIVNCTDGSLAPDCSENKPYQCLNGSLISMASVCGCPENYMAVNDTCEVIKRCDDGTIYDQCSTNQPLICENGALSERASVCGCPEGLTIESIGNMNGEKCIINRNFNTQTSTPFAPVNLYDIETQIHTLINEQRTANSLPALSFDEALASIARKHSQDMARRNYFEHDDPEGHDFYWRMQQDGYNCGISIGNMIYQGAENIYEESGYPTSSIASSAVDSWMTSEGHRANILTPYWRNEGIGIAKSGSGAVYVTQVFC